LLLHGLPDFWLGWREQMDWLASRYSVFAPDLRGLNLSSRPVARSTYTMGLLVKDALAVLDAQEVPAAHLVGHDWGGMIAWWLAMLHPGRVLSLTVIAAPHPLDYLTAVREQPAMLDYLKHILQPSDWHASIGTLTREIRDGAYKACLQKVLQDAGSSTIANYYLSNLHVPPRQSRLQPTPISHDLLCIYGGADRAVPISSYDQVDRRSLGTVCPLVIEDGGHFLTHTHGPTIAAALMDHLDRSEAKSAAAMGD
jgi:epoxide hydrolase 4